jgi:phytoene dehydrogenase-like protein
MAAHLANLAAWHSLDAGWPAGGSLSFAQAIARRYLGLGGAIHFRSPVEKVLVETWPRLGRRAHRAVGVRLADGTEHRADDVVSAADGRTTIVEMLGGRYVNDEIRAYYDEAPRRQEHGVLVCLGVARDLSDAPHAVTYLLEQPVTIAGDLRERLTVEHYCFDPTMAPAGKSVMEVWLDSRYSAWKGMYGERDRYDAEKQRVADAVIGQLEGYYPGIRDQIEVVDVATPLTIERYTGNWQGAEAWFPARNRLGVMLKGLSRTLPGLERFYMVGQWAGAAGGLPTAATSGRTLIQTLCRRDRHPFVTKVPVG